MNAQFHKVIFSKRLGTLVAVGEHACAQGKSASGEGARGAAMAAAVFLSGLTSAFALNPSALPTGHQVAAGQVQVTSSGARMDISQLTDKAVVNWQSFNVGSGASVHIAQPSASAVLLNRVVGNEVSQIRGQINANGQVVLVNPNGIVMGPTGRITASAFTASTFGISDADFQAGQKRFQRSATSGAVVNQGSIESTDAGGYVALIGADVSNQGTITTRQGAVVLAAADAVVMPNTPGFDTQKISVPLSRNVRLELNPAAFGPASVSNSGVIVTDGGQVLMRAAAVVDAVSKIADATVVQSGNIDTSGNQAGRVDILADEGRIRVSGSVTANSAPQPNLPNTSAGADIYIGRDELTNVLAAVGDVRGAQLESLDGFVETSGQFLATLGVSVKAKDWLLDPTSIRIVATNSATPDTASSTSSGTTTFQDDTPSGGPSIDTSEVLKSTIESAINNGTNVTIRTANPHSTGAGDITIETDLSFTNNSSNAATLSLIAVNGITQHSGATITATGSQLVHVVMDANGRFAGQDVSNNQSRGITLASAISTNGDVTLIGRAIHTEAANATNGIAVSIQSGANLTGRNISITGNSANSFDISAQGGMTTTGGGNVTLTGNSLSLSGNPISAGAGTVTIQNRTAGTLIDVGGTSSDVLTGTRRLGISSAELSLINASNLVIGRNDSLGSGLLTVAGALNMGAMGNTSGNLTLISGGDLLLALNQSITKSAGSDATLTMRANGDINLWNGSSISSASNKLNVVLNSDADANSAGAIRLILSSITSNGGNITMGGGVNATGYASGSSTLANGIWFNGSNLFSGGGNIALKGRSSAGTNSDGGANAGIWFRDEAATIDINAGSGSITMDGLSQSTHASAHTHGVMLGGFGTRTTIQTSSSAVKAIDITGVGSASSPNASGVWINSTAALLSTGTGGISLDGTDRSATGAGETAGVFFKNGRVLSASGQVHITGASQAARGIEMNWADGQGGIIGSQAGSAITSSTANIVLSADSMRLGATTLSAINTSGTVTLQNRTAGTLIDVGGTSSDVLTGTLKLGLSADELARITAATTVVGRNDATGSGLVSVNALNMGSMGNTSGNLTVRSGGNIAVNGAVTKTAGTDATLSLLANGNINVASSTTITGSSGKLNVVLNSNSDGLNGGGIVFNTGSGVTSNGGNISLGGGTALNGSGTAAGDGINTTLGISLVSAAFNAGGGNITMTGTTWASAPTAPSIQGIRVNLGSIQTSGVGTINLTGYNNTTTNTNGVALSLAGVTITGGSTGSVSLTGDSRAAATPGNYIYGVAMSAGTKVTSDGANIDITGYGGNGSGGIATNIGVSITGGSVAGVGAGTVTISGTGGQGSNGQNYGVYTSTASTSITSQGGDINITGQGGNGVGSVGILIGGGTFGVAAGTASANVILTTDSAQLQSSTINSGTGTTTIQNRTAGTLINVGGADVLTGSPLTLGITNAEMNLISAGTLKIGSTNTGAMTTSAAITTAAAMGNLFLQSGSTLAASHAIASGAGLYLQTNGGALTNSAALSGTNISLDNSNGSINLATGAITNGAGITAASDGITVSGSLTATTNLNVYGASGSANGVLTSANWSGQYINAIGTTTTGYTGFAWNGGTINTTGTGGTSTASTVKGTSAASSTASNGFGAFMMFANGAANAANSTTLTLAGEATTLTTGQNIKQRGILVQGGRTLTMSGDVTLDGSSKSSEGISFGGTVNMTTVAGVTNKLTIKGTAAASSNSTLNAINMSGVINSNASTSSINLIGDAKNLSGTSWDRGVNISGAINGGTSNVNIQSTGANITTSAAIAGANISIDNTNGSINSSTGAITVGSANSGSAVGISVGSSITATGNLNMWGASTNNTGINVLASSTLRGGNIQATGRVNNGGYGLLLNAGSSVITTGTSGDSLVRGINTNGGSNAVLTGGSPTLTAATGTTLTLWGDGTNTGDRAMRVDGGAITNGAVTIKGTSNNATALMLINGLVTANANSSLTLEGTTANSGQHGVLTINSGGVALSNGATVSIIGQNTHLSGTAAGVMLLGSGIGKVGGATSAGQVSITGNASSTTANTGASVQAGVTTDGNITIAGSVGSAAGTGVSIVGAVSSSGTGTSINVSSNHGISHTGSLNIAGANGTGGNILITSTLGGLTGTGTIGTTTQRHTSVTVTQAGTSTFSGAINAANFTKAGAGSLTLDSWVATTPANTNISNAYTVSSGSLSLSPHMTYAGIDPASVNVVNNATFSLSNTGNGFWRNTAFNFTGGQGGGTMNLLGNPIGSSNTTNTFSTSGGATNTINGLLNANNANVNLNLAAATGGTTLLDGSFAALVFAQNAQGGFGLDNATTISTNGPGGLLFLNRVKATQLNVNSGTVQFGNGSAATAAATPELQATNVAIASGAHLIFNRAEAQTNASVFTGNGSLTQAGAGTLTLTGNNSGFAGSATVNAGRTLAIGTNGNFGAAGSTLHLASATASVGFTNTTGTSTIGSTISGVGTLSKSGAGTGVLTANNTYTGTTTVSGGTLQVGNGGTTGTLGAGAVTLSNNANLHYSRSATTQIFNTISGTGNLSSTITGASSNLSVSGAVNLTGGTINLSTDANLTLSQSLITDNTTNAAIVLNAGAATNAGTSTGGDISFTGSGAVNVGTGGRATLFTGSLSGSTGLGVTTGNNRYNSDEQTSSNNYTAALGSGKHAIYREAPTLNVRFNNVSKTYDALAFTGGNGLSVVSGLVNGDTSTTFSGITYSGTAQNATNAGTFAISGTALNSQGYVLSYTNGTLTIDKANLVLSGSRDYNATTTFAGQFLTAAGVAGQSFSLTGSGHSSNLSSQHVASNQNVALSTVTGLSLGASSNGGLADNYNAISTAGSSVTLNKANLVLSGSRDYDATTTFAGQFLTAAGVAGQTFSLTGSGHSSNLSSQHVTNNQNVALSTVTGLSLGASSNGGLADNYNAISTAGSSVTLNKANLVLSGSRDYDASTTFAGTHLTATGVAGQTFNVTGSGHSSNLASKHVGDNQNVTLNSLTGLSLGASSNGGLADNYNAISTAGSTVSLRTKAASVTGVLTNATYDGQLHTQTAATTSGFLHGDQITITGLASGTNAANYTSSLAATGDDAANYSVTVTQAQLRIARRDITLTGLTAADKTFDGNSTASITGASFGNLVPGQTLGLSGAGAFNDAQVGNNKTVTVTEVANLTQDNGTGRWQNYNLTTSGSFTTLASIRAAAPGPGPNPSKDESRPDWPKVERLNRRPADHLLAQPNNTSAYALAQDDPDANVITVRGCGAGQEPEWRDSCLPISPSYTARYN